MASTGPPVMKYAFADAVLGLSFESLEPAVVDQAKRVFLYHVCTAFMGRQAAELNPAAGFAVIEALGNPPGPCTVIGHDLRLAATDAAYLNCHLIGGGGYDDVIFPAGMHAGLMVVPVAMAMAESQRSSGREFIAALVAGYEILGKIGRWTWSTASPRRPGPVFGPMATAGVCAQLLGLDREQTATAIGYAAHAAMGLPCNLNTQIHAMACRAGIMSALYARAGGRCPADIIEGPLGFYRTFFGSSPASAAEVLEDFGRNHAIMASREKRYSGTMLNLVAVEKARELILRHGLSADNVASVKLQLSEQRRRHPTAQLRPPYARPLEAFASCHFLIALLLLDGDIREDLRGDSKDDPEVLDVAGRVEARFVEHPNPIYARVNIRTKEGGIYEAEGDDHVFAPLDAAALLRKHARDVLSGDRIDRLVRSTAQLEKSRDVSELFSLLTPDTVHRQAPMRLSAN